MGPKTALSCLIFWSIFQSTLASSCDLIVRVADLQEIIKNQTKQAVVQTQLMEGQREVIEDQKRMIADVLKTVDDLEKTVKHLRDGLYFMAGLNDHKSFPGVQIIKFGKVITNIGSGYIDDVNNADYGKFIAPENGTYQFNANLYNEDARVGGDLLKNGALIISATGGNGGGSGSLSAILDLTEGDEVYLGKPGWLPTGTVYSRYFTSFSGVLIRADN